MNVRQLVSLVMVALLLVPLPTLGAGEAKEYRVPFRFAVGKGLFEQHCGSCHGVQAQGSEQGPPLIHIYYEPSHHGDNAFQSAVANGVRQHHWGFGDMAPVAGVTSRATQQITHYIRWLQQQNGIH